MVSRTPAKAAPASAAKQRSITSFFSKTPTQSPSASTAAPLQSSNNTANAAPMPPLPATKASRLRIETPAQSSDPVEPSSPAFSCAVPSSVVKPAGAKARMPPASSPTRKKGKVNYAESEDDDEDAFAFLDAQAKRRARGRRAVLDDDDDDYDAAANDAAAPADEDDEMADFVVSDDEEARPKKRKRESKPAQPRKKKAPSPKMDVDRDDDQDDEDDGVANDTSALDAMQLNDMPSRTLQWAFDPDAPEEAEAPAVPRKATAPKPKAAALKQKAHQTEPSERYEWLAKIKDMDGNPPDHPDYNPSTLYVPPRMFKDGKGGFSPFEKQYWAIKQKLWDTIVFFKKGKFYELYENDATIGHQLFDFKMTDRVNMRMVGVPESSLDIWVNQFVAKGYKVARVDQMESALGKSMRERETAAKADKIIRRELACILTAGTLVEGSMLQGDLATYCAAIKELPYAEKPTFGIAFVDTATGRFFVTEFEDDVDLTKFETLVAQTTPRELVLEKGQLSSKALRILKNNLGPMTIWNYRKPESEFWDADSTRRDIRSEKWFSGEDDASEGEWPEALKKAEDKDLLMSALGGLVQYLRVLKLDRNLLSQGSFEWYNAIQSNGTLILDGKTLINLEVFQNSVDGGATGTLFALLNRCVTPFGKRLLRQWVAHPLCDVRRITERLDAVDMFNADRSLLDEFASSLSKMPDLERLLSRIHAGRCRGDDFLRVVEGFEKIVSSMSFLGAYAGGSALVDRLVASMPDLTERLEYWTSAFDRSRARTDKVIIPQPGIEADYDDSNASIDAIKLRLQALLNAKKTELNCRTLKFTDVGKEIYQVEAPKSVRVPSSWRQMSATASVKRWYFDELTVLVRELQEAEETHSQISRDVVSRILARFDEHHDEWNAAIRIVSQLDCLVSLARVSSSLGEPSCRPEFINADRSVVEFTELRHPCLLGSISDFIPNDILLGGPSSSFNLLTGANAAGKSTILRMTCSAVIMAQVGCYVPAQFARMTPVDRIMSRLGARDNIYGSQSTFFVELAETKKILSEATPRSLVILDELGRGTSTYDGIAVAHAVLHHLATHVGCLGFFATHYHSLVAEFAAHPEVRARRMRIHVDDEERKIHFLYKLEDGVAEGSFGMHCASMCGIAAPIVARAEEAAREFEHTSKMSENLERAKDGAFIPAGVMSDIESILNGDGISERGLDVLMRMIDDL